MHKDSPSPIKRYFINPMRFLSLGRSSDEIPDPAARHDAVDMRMMHQVLSPGVIPITE
jgi:hypothetical protein